MRGFLLHVNHCKFKEYRICLPFFVWRNISTCCNYCMEVAMNMWIVSKKLGRRGDYSDILYIFWAWGTHEFIPIFSVIEMSSSSWLNILGCDNEWVYTWGKRVLVQSSRSISIFGNKVVTTDVRNAAWLPNHRGNGFMGRLWLYLCFISIQCYI